MTDLNAPHDATERDALAWRMLEERLEMCGVDDLSWIAEIALDSEEAPKSILRAVHDALAYRRQT